VAQNPPGPSASPSLAQLFASIDGPRPSSSAYSSANSGNEDSDSQTKVHDVCIAIFTFFLFKKSPKIYVTTKFCPPFSGSAKKLRKRRFKAQEEHSGLSIGPKQSFRHQTNRGLSKPPPSFPPQATIHAGSLGLQKVGDDERRR
jgi:hypothetical protein